ncbi:uncharacterized protein DUF3297 [Roseiarcus fermentans]|uniref:Uncharacterized protein DUF3297 n=1 Tax=Roseiarcus fermentans TaxID=1473586 RepID=A0A366F3E2_9HYPH|nr:DUF3297 family protein [Roseiarcus fermentans]RBP08666.1 uncharacterized protein DUF3297 [Roseiarcus fermentans]
MTAQTTDAPPDRLSIDPASPHYDGVALARGVGIRFRGSERTDVEEYCVSENWIRAPAGKTRDRKGNLLLVKLTGPVEPYFVAPAAPTAADGN